MKTKVLLKKGEGRTINAGGLWIYDNEIKEIHGHFKNGDIVDVYAHNEYPLGRGYINQNSKIRIRLMTRNINQEIDSDFLRMRLQNAWQEISIAKHKTTTRSIHCFFTIIPGIL